ncbi:MAG: ABC transporter permease, partial [Alphaproteobacteria bacterium]|nr:ABC transporter permease [Alphaproteobacteria bacterium]
MRWLLHRSLVSLALAGIVATIVFLTLHAVPGDPAEILLSTGGAVPDAAAVAEMRSRLGLDRPILEQYGEFIARLARGDLGRSLVDDHPVWSEIALRLPRTLELILAGTLIALVLGMPAGTYAAINRGGVFDRLASGAAALLLAVPIFVVGTLLVLVLAKMLRWMPAGGYVPFARDPAQHLLLLTLPALAVAKGLTAVVFRMTRAAVLDALSRDWVRTARAKGLSPARVLVHHVVRNSLTPVFTVLGLHMGT